MLSIRRVPLLSVLALCVLFLIYRSQWSSPSKPLYPAVRPPPTFTPAPKITKGPDYWADQPTKYPAPSFAPLPTGKPLQLPHIQATFEKGSQSSTSKERQKIVKDAFVHCWSSYKTRAWGMDELAPLSGRGRNAFGGWGATLVDSLDTLHIMGLTEELDEAIAAVAKLDFSSSTEALINIFETTIRYLGGFLAAYDLTGNEILRDKAIEIADMIYVAFDTPNRMPVTRWNWRQASTGEPQVASEWTLVSEIGSLSLEFTRLAQVTGNPKWYDAVDRITKIFDQQQFETHLPGMWPVLVNAKEQNFTMDSAFTMGGMSDSMYEYLPKMYALLGGLDPTYRKLYEGAIAPTIEHLFFRPMAPGNPDILLSGNVRANSPAEMALDPQGQHLACFTGGMLGIGARLFEQQSHIDIARKLVDGCIWAYNSMPWGVMAETFHVMPCPSTTSCSWDEGVWKAEVLRRFGYTPEDDAAKVIAENRLPPGYTEIGDHRYILRPEAIESVFILYRITGDPELQEAAWKMFTTIQKLTTTKFANAALDDISIPELEPPKSDRMESFWMAETLKYFYLIFSDPDLISLDEYVLNTEAHPFKRPA